jgi:UDP-N-acetylglucosamine acyltransferase
MSVTLDPRAVVSPKAHLGTNVSIGPFAIVEEGAVIGDGTTVAHHAFIASGARIGRDCRIHHAAVVGHAPQDLKYAGEPTTCEVGDRTTIREFATFHRGTGEAGRTVVGSDGFFMAYTHVAHDCQVGNSVIMSNAAMLAGHCHVGDFVIIGGITPVHQFVNIGKHAMIGGGLRVPKDVPPFVLAGGEPVVFEGLNSIGLRRRGFPPAVVEALDRAYTLIYRSGLNVSQAVAKIKEDSTLAAVTEVQEVIAFIAASKRGIVHAHRLKG